MKRHHVDELFKEKLNNWEPKTSEKIWEKLEARQAARKNRKISGWYGIAAASVAFLLLAGSYFLQSTETNTLSVASPAIKTASAPGGVALRNAASTQASVKAPKHMITPSQKTLPRQQKERDSPMNNLPANHPSEPLAVSEQPVLNTPPSGTVQPESSRQTSSTEESLNAKAARILAGTPDISKAQKNEPIPAQTVVVFVETSNHGDEPEEPGKPSRFRRILKQLKKAKEGEKVEWNEVGIHPAQLFTKAEESLREEELNITRQYKNLKNKINL